MYEIFIQLMESRKLTPYKVSKDTGITQATLSRWKTGKASPSIETLQLLSNYFGVTVDYLLGNEDIKCHPTTQIGVTNMNRIAQLRKEFNLNQKDLSKLLGVAQNTISQWENGNRDPDTNSLIALASFFHVTTDYLLGIDAKNGPATQSGSEPANNFTEEDIQLLEALKALSPRDKSALLAQIAALNALRDQESKPSPNQKGHE